MEIEIQTVYRRFHPVLVFYVLGYVITLMGFGLGVGVATRYDLAGEMAFGYSLLAIMAIMLGVVFTLIGLSASSFRNKLRARRVK